MIMMMMMMLMEDIDGRSFIVDIMCRNGEKLKG